jgi:DNA polymerase III epsilon subunit-like protein
VLLEEFVAPEEKVTDFRTKVSGIRPADLRNAISFDDAMRRTHAILAGRTVIGHALHNDFKVSFSSASAHKQSQDKRSSGNGDVRRPLRCSLSKKNLYGVTSGIWAVRTARKSAGFIGDMT